MSANISAFLIDLDDTLYDERQFVDEGYRAVAAQIAKHHNCNTQAVFARLSYEHQKYGRARVFNRTLEFFNIESPISELVETYRSAPRQLQFYPGVKSVLKRLRERAPVIVVTDGLETMQKAKVDALGLDKYVDGTVFCWAENAPKPDPAAFYKAMQLCERNPREALIIGDDPWHDGMAANSMGINFCRVRTGKYGSIEFPSLPSPIWDIADITQILPALDITS